MRIPEISRLKLTEIIDILSVLLNSDVITELANTETPNAEQE